MKDMLIEIREYIGEGRNGDRALKTIPASKFEVWMVEHNNPTRGFCLHVEDQVDHVNSHVADRREVLKCATAYAESVADMLFTTVTHRFFRRQLVETWIENI